MHSIAEPPLKQESLEQPIESAPQVSTTNAPPTLGQQEVASSVELHSDQVTFPTESLALDCKSTAQESSPQEGTKETVAIVPIQELPNVTASINAELPPTQEVSSLESQTEHTQPQTEPQQQLAQEAPQPASPPAASHPPLTPSLCHVC